MSIETFVLILSSLINLFLATLIYFKNPKSKVNIFFAASILMLVLWNISVIFAQQTNELIIWVKNAYFFSTFALILFLFFLKHFPSPSLPFNKLLFWLLVISGVIFLILIYPTHFLIKISSPFVHIKGVDRSLVFGFGLRFYLFYLIFFILFVVHAFFSKYRKANKLQKSQIRFTASGIILFIFLAVLTNLFIPHLLGVQLGNIGPAFSFIMVGFIGYAIGRYKLFEIKIIATELLIGIIGVILLIQAAIAETLFWQIVGFLVLFAFTILGYLLIKSVYKEISYRRALQKAYDDLQRLDRAKTEFISIASHQLRTPLTAIKGYVSLLLEGSYGKIPQKAKKPLENISKTNDQLVKLVNNLLDISRIESGKTVLSFQKISIDELIEEIISELKVEADKKGLYIKIKKPSFVPQITADPEKIKQVFLNLIDNAIKYTFKGGVVVSIQPFPAKLLIKIMDTGIGIEKKDLPSLFETFKRGKSGAKAWTGGAGIGVYIAKKFIDAHHGKIWVESKGKNQGTTFYVELPLNPKKQKPKLNK